MRRFVVFSLLLTMCMGAAGLAQPPAEDEFVIGLVLFNRWGNRGSSYSHYEAARYVEQTIPNTRVALVENFNPVDTPGRQLSQEVERLVNEEGARLIITTAAEYERSTVLLADLYPDVFFVNVGGDAALLGAAPPNFINVDVQMEWGMLIAGCAAGLETQTGRIGYVGTLPSPEARRLASSAYLGARYCYSHYRALPASNVTFDVTWIGYAFRTAETLNPFDVTRRYYRDGFDVVISGVDSAEAIVAAGLEALTGRSVKVVPYDYVDACQIAPNVCLGQPNRQWHSIYASLVRRILADDWQTDWEWLPPVWGDLNNPLVSPVGFDLGDGLSPLSSARLRGFITNLGLYASNQLVPTNEFDLRAFGLWTGELQLGDGTELAAPGQVVDPLDIWYLPQLLRGMTISPNSR